MGTAIPQEGTTSNKYTILGRLAGGGMADIYLARASNDAGVERHVVLKRVLGERARDPMLARMFLDEARLASQLQHPNIAQVHDIGTLAGSYFFTMEFVHGEDVRNILQKLARQAAALPVNHALHVAAGALAALHHAHERTTSAGKPLGIVHRDVSPSNVMVAFEGVVKLVDFGVAKAASRELETRSGVIKGKISYLSPEQCHGKRVDRRSDIFSLGIVLHEMLTGKRLYKRVADFDTMLAIANEKPPAPSSLRPGISPALDAIVLKALEKDPGNRYATARDMLEAIEMVASSERHVLSATAMGRYMRELFGDRQEPWVTLAAENEFEPSKITITGESFTPGDGLLPAQLPGREVDLAVQRNLQDALDRAPALKRQTDEGAIPQDIEQFVSGPLELIEAAPSPRATPPPTPSAPLPVVPRSDTTPLPSAAASGSIPRRDTPKPMSVVILEGDPPEIEHRRRWIAVATIAGIVMIVVIARWMQSSGESEHPDAAIAQVEPDAAIETPPPVDAAPAVMIDAAPPTIASAVTAKDWETARALCGKGDPKATTSDVRVACALAACNAADTPLAKTFYGLASSRNKPAIEKACSEHGITLRTASRANNPCAANPLKCRK